MLERERVANRKKHWVRAVTACNSHCLFCLDSDTPRNLFLPFEEVCAELLRGRAQLDADKVIISGGEASLHPRFHDLVRHARSIGYERVQTVTNGWRFADKPFYDEAVAAGLGEITFSLHGHTAALHDHLTQHEGAFARLLKGMVRAVRRRELIVNVDVVINQQNVAVLDQIVELCIGLGVSEFDLLHVIPQAAAFTNRDVLFYDPRAHLPVLHKVFRLNRHPGFTVWTNRFPVSFLEGLEDLIQDPHKMLDEVNGRRFQVRRALDAGVPLDCRDAARCPHCFIEPFCTSTDRVVAALRQDAVEVWEIGGDPAIAGLIQPDGRLAFGAHRLALTRRSVAELLDPARGEEGLPIELPLRLRLDHLDAASLLALGPRDVQLDVDSAEQLDAWRDAASPESDPFPARPLRVHLNQRTAPWLLAHRALLGATLPAGPGSRSDLPAISLHQPSWEHLEGAVAHDVRDPGAFFAALDLRIAVSGLPPCLTPGARLLPDEVALPQRLFDPDTGRLAVRALAEHHVAARYRARSLRCADCRVEARCEGLPINMARDQGLSLCRPLTTGDWADEAERQLRALLPTAPVRVGQGRPSAGAAPPLPGAAPLHDAPEDPLAVVARASSERRRRRRLEILA